MDRNIYDNDFEEFLKQKSDQYKMYPSDRVWNNVYSSLHGRKKWWALGFTLLFLAAGLIVGRQLLLSNYNHVAIQVNQGAEDLSVTEQPTIKVAASLNQHDNTRQHAPDATLNGIAGNSLPAISTSNAGTNSINQQRTNTAEIQSKPELDEAGIVASNELSRVIENNLLPAIPTLHHTTPVAGVVIPQNKLTVPVTGAADKITEVATKPLSQLSNTAAISAPLKTSRWSLQFYASPTISYRRLSNFNKEGNNYVPVATGYAGDINKYVHHKSAAGFELGSNVQYQLSPSLTVFGGAQINYSRYYIDAFKYQTEKASIALNNSTVHDTVSGYTNIRNFSGYAPEQLQNKYLQLSLPVGIEIKLLGNRNLQFSVAGGIQPTFLLSSTSYLISSDYKNYIQSPDLARGFNVHTNFEAFISYKTGGLKWQIGPQFRSQLLSSYSNQYRVREYLTEYGIKFGVTRTF